MDKLVNLYQPLEEELISPYEAIPIGELETDTSISEAEIQQLFETSFEQAETYFTPYQELEWEEALQSDLENHEALAFHSTNADWELEEEYDAFYDFEEDEDFEEGEYLDDVDYESHESKQVEYWEEHERATDWFVPQETQEHVDDIEDFIYEEEEMDEYTLDAEVALDYGVPQSGELENEAQYLFEDFWSNLSKLWQSRNPAAKPHTSTNYWIAFAKRAACIAEKEWKAWGKGSIHESNPSFQSKLHAYFSSTQLNSTRVERSTKSNLGRKGSPWSAAFISYVMKKAGAGEYFHYNSSHLNYILRAKKNKQRGINNPFQLFDLHQAKPQVGDLVCNSRGCYDKTYQNVDRAKSTRCGDSEYAATYSHCDIVVEVDESNNRVWVIGGNTGNNTRAFGGRGSNTVGKKSRRLDSNGYLVKENRIFALLKVRKDLNVPAPTQNPVFTDCSSPAMRPSTSKPSINTADPVDLSAQFVSKLSNLLNQGLISMSVFLALVSGNRNANQLTDMLFHSRHPELKGRKLKKSDRALIREWKKIKRDIIMPLVSHTPPPSLPASTQAPRTQGTANPAKSRFLNKLKPYENIILAKARKYKLNPNIIRAIIAAESNGDPQKTSVANYKGLMQAGKSASHYNPAVSIEAGAKKFAEFKQTVISNFRKRSGVDLSNAPEKSLLRLTLASYNAGPVTVIKALEYAHKAGNWENWLEAAHYQRALIFSGGYHTYKKCHRKATRQAIKEAVNAKWKFAGWRRSKIGWRDFQDPPLFHLIQMPAIMRCWVNTKYQNTIPYLKRFDQYI